MNRPREREAVHVLDYDRIVSILPELDLVPLIEEGFAAYSSGRAVVPPVGEMIFEDPPGDVHIKYGYLIGNDYYVIKIASGFYRNPVRGLPTGDGMMLLFCQQSGQLLSIMLDRGLLTQVRTAVAGAIVAKYLAPDPVTCIGIVGSGTQARFQLQHLGSATPCREVMVLGKVPDEVERYRAEMSEVGYSVEVARSSAELAAACNLIVTTTPATTPVLWAEEVRPGSHITAMGSDTPHKQELDSEILATADRLVADSITQCLERGEIFHALRSGHITRDDLVELGDVIAGRAPGRTGAAEITVADLTGVAVQDIQIARAVYEALRPEA